MAAPKLIALLLQMGGKPGLLGLLNYDQPAPTRESMVAEMTHDDEESEGAGAFVAAITLSSSAILVALVQALHDKGVLDAKETVEVYE